MPRALPIVFIVPALCVLIWSPDIQGQSGGSLTFTDATTAAGIRFTHTNGAFGKKYLPETMGSGVAFLDFDGDGWQDLFFVNGQAWPGQKAARSLPALYRNTGKGSFVDVTSQARLAVETYGMGAAAADYDNDGDVDLFVTALARNFLYRNDGKGAFEDVTTKAGVGASDFSTSAAWVDYDKDGWLDLLIVNYVQWAIDKDLFCALDGKNKSYCTPEAYKGASPRLFRNRRGTGRSPTSRRPPACWSPRRKPWALRCSTSMPMAGWICSSRTTRSPTACIATRARARS